jgi:hypothetical protein
MTDPVKKIKNAAQDVEAKMETSKDHVTTIIIGTTGTVT